MMKKALLTLAVLGMSSVGFAKTVATVNGTQIDSKTIDEQVSLLKKQSNGQIQDSPELRASITDRLVAHTVIVQEAKKLKLDNTAESKEIVAQAKAEADKAGESKKPTFSKDFALFQSALLEQAYAVNVLEKNPISDAQVRKEYDQLSTFYKGSQEVQLAEVVTDKEADVKKVLADLAKGKKFADVAKQYTIDPQGKTTGGKHQGYINLKDMQAGSAVLFESINPLKKGQYTKEPLSTNGIFVVFYVDDRRKASVPEFDKLKEPLRAQLESEAVNKSVGDLIKKATIKR